MNTSKKSFNPDFTRTGNLTQTEAKKPVQEQVDTKKVLEMFESTYTEQLYDRKANYILKFCKQRKDGFFFEEIQDITKIIEYSIKDLNEGVMEMRNAIKKIAEIASMPFLKRKSSDEYVFSKHLPEFLNSFKPLLTSQRQDGALEPENSHRSNSSVVIMNLSDDLRSACMDFIHKFVNEGIDDIKMQEESFEEKKV
mmetsp:Transcript_35571/g.32054  ORF Transcript_35571/g.32054 Transcript_35571/m.32054 type:complete len:196 (+) Transcript_35571:57-644(+)